MLKGLAWCCVERTDAVLASALADAAIEGYRKITWLSPRSAKLAGACVYALARMPCQHGAAQLERVRLNVKQPTSLKRIEQALNEAAHRLGISHDELLELTVPTFGLEQNRLRVSIGGFVAELHIEGSSTRLHWEDASGHALKAAPAAVKRTYQAELTDLKRQVDGITRLLGAQRDRLERLPLAGRTWPLAAWRERYLDHPLVGCLARRLLWRFTDGERSRVGIWNDGQIVDVNDRPLDLSETTIVSAWHPVLCEVAEVLAWRTWLEQHQVTQPFKQAHCEVYLLTEAERATSCA